MENQLQIIFSQQIYDDFINDSSDEIMKNIFFDNNFIDRENISETVFKSQTMLLLKNLEYYYFKSLNDNIFNDFSNNNIDIYLKIKQNSQNIFLNIKKIYNFYITEVVEDALKHLLSIINLTEEYYEYNNSCLDFIQTMESLINDDDSENFSDVMFILEDFYSMLNNNDYYDDLSKNPIIIEKDQKKYLSDFFISKLSYIFFIKLKNQNSTNIEYNQDFLNNFIFSPFK